MKTKDLIAQAISLPVDERSVMPNIDKKWTAVAKHRLTELCSGSVKVVPGDEVFKKIWNKFQQ